MFEEIYFIIQAKIQANIQFRLMFEEIYFIIQAKMTKSRQKSVKIVYLKCKENIYLEYMNINRQPAATWLMIGIKHQPDRAQVDV